MAVRGQVRAVDIWRAVPGLPVGAAALRDGGQALLAYERHHDLRHAQHSQGARITCAVVQRNFPHSGFKHVYGRAPVPYFLLR